MNLYLTYCSNKKDPALIRTKQAVTPDLLYQSPRIREFIEACKGKNAYWAIFSDLYGIWFPCECHEWYDKSPDDVTESEFNRLVLQAAERLRNYDVFFFADEKDSRFHSLYRTLIEELRVRGIRITLFNDLSLVVDQQDSARFSPDSGILFLTICSFGKRTEGFPLFSGMGSFLDTVDVRFVAAMKKRRRDVLNLVRKGKIVFNQANQKDHEYNSLLLRGTGREFGGSDPAFYLPAIWRYDGRFFQGLGVSGKRAIVRSPHHFLILSGLYGILTPDELIQCYSVPLYEGDPVQKVWTGDRFLTRALSDYLTRQGIRRIYDFTAIQYYRDLIDWQFLKQQNPDTEIFHAFSTLGAGENALLRFGKVLGENLLFLNGNELLAIAPEERIGDVYFRTIYQPWPEKPGDLSLPPGSAVLDLKYIIDDDSRNILRSAEHETRMFMNSSYNPEDAGSTILWHYSKGLERIMHHACAVRIKRYLLRQYSSEQGLIAALPKYPNSRNPDAMRSIASAQPGSNIHQLTLGTWVHLPDELHAFRNNPVSRTIQQFLDDEFGSGFSKLTGACSRLKDYRNPATHRKIYPVQEALALRNILVREINAVISICYCDPRRLERMVKSPMVEDRIDGAKALQNISEDWSNDLLLSLLEDTVPAVRRRAAEALGAVRCHKALEHLRRFTDDPDIGLRYASRTAIQKIEEDGKGNEHP